MSFNEKFFLTSDTHFCHQQGFLYQPRGFQSAEEMNETIVERWNKVVDNSSIVFHLGDMCLNDNVQAAKVIKRLNGKIYWIRGNHDTDNRIDTILSQCPNVQLHDCQYAVNIRYGKINFYLSHYPTLTANFDDSHFNQHVINLHGHTHQQKNWLFPDNPFIYHIGADSHMCAPVGIDEVVTDIRNRWNELGGLNVKPHGIYNNYPLMEEN